MSRCMSNEYTHDEHDRGTGTETVLELGTVFVFSERGVPVYDSLKSYTYVDLCTCIHTNVSSTHPAVCGGPCQIRTTNMYIYIYRYRCIYIYIYIYVHLYATGGGGGPCTRV